MSQQKQAPKIVLDMEQPQGRRNRSIAQALVIGAGKQTAAEVAEAAQNILREMAGSAGNEKVSAQQVSAALKGFNGVGKYKGKLLPPKSAERSGRAAAPPASAEEHDDFISELEGLAESK